MTKRPKLLLAILIILSNWIYLIGNGSVALWDRDEPRYAQTSRQMLQSGDWIVPHFLNLVRTAKPPLIYWCQASAMKVFGDNAFAARFPSAVATTLLLIILSLVLYRPLGPERTLWTIFIFATSGLVIAAAKMCLTDAVLMLWITIAQLCLYNIWRGRASWPIVIVLAIAMGLAGLTKGPVILGFQVMTLLVLGALRLLDRRYPPIPSEEIDVFPRRRFTLWKAVVGILIVVVIVLPWILAVNHRAPAFVKTAVQHDIWDRMLTPLEQHVGPPGYYLLTIWATFFPWSLILPLAIGFAVRYRSNPRTRFALAAIIGPWIMLECIRTKLPHYFLPAFPMLAFLAADALVRCLHGDHQDLRSRSFLRGAGIWAILVATLSLAPWLTFLVYYPESKTALLFLSILGTLYAATVFYFFIARRIQLAAVVMGTGMMALVVELYAIYLPRAEFLRLSPRVAAVLIKHEAVHPNQVIMLDYMEPSLAFDQGGTLREAGEVGLNHRSIAGFTPWMVVTHDIWQTAPADVRSRFDIVATVHGLAYADKGRWMDVMVIRKHDR